MCFSFVFNMWKSLSILAGYTLILLPLSSGLYFHIAETERKCFIEEIPDETTVIGMYSTGVRQYSFVSYVYCSLLFVSKIVRNVVMVVMYEPLHLQSIIKWNFMIQRVAVSCLRVPELVCM